MKIMPLTTDVYGTDEQVVVIDHELIAFLKERVKESERHRARFCAHPDVSDSVHEMIIALGRKTAIAPHRHHGKSESFHVIEGEADIVLFSDDGKIEQVVAMGPPDSGKAFYYRVSAPLYHTVLVRSDVFIFQETTKGPWDRAESEEAPWAPPEDSAELTDYLSKLDLSEGTSS